MTIKPATSKTEIKQTSV